MLAGNHELEDFTDLAPATLANIGYCQPHFLPEIVPMLGPTWSSVDFATRLEVAYGYCHPDGSALYFWLVLAQQGLDVACLTMAKTKANGTFLRYVSLVSTLAFTMGRVCADLESWRPLLRDVVSLNGVQIPFEHEGESPMLGYLGFHLHSYFRGSMADLSYQRLTCKLRSWANEVRVAGQDLQKYSRWEQEFLSTRNGEFARYNTSVTVRLVNFKYGPSPQDWQIWVSTSMDESAGEFWEAVEDGEPVLDVPGSWPTLDPGKTEYWPVLSLQRYSRRRRRRFLRYLGLELEREDDVFDLSSPEDTLQRHIVRGKETKARRRKYYLGNNISPPCREFVS